MLRDPRPRRHRQRLGCAHGLLEGTLRTTPGTGVFLALWSPEGSSAGPEGLRLGHEAGGDAYLGWALLGMALCRWPGASQEERGLRS